MRLFDADLPDGFRYSPDFLTADEENLLVRDIRGVEFSTFEMHGVAARRRVAFFGASYERSAAPLPALPGFLVVLRDKLAPWSGIDAAAFTMALINEYPPGAPIGWHRDAPQYDVVAGISLLSTCRMKFRPYVSPGAAAFAGSRRVATHEVVLEPRSAYLMTGESRYGFEHHIPAVSELRYSITFRTARRR